MNLIEEAELKELQEIQSKYLEIIANLGQAEIELINLDEKTAQLNQLYQQVQNYKEVTKTSLNELKVRETEFATAISTKYGNVSINPETGEISEK